MHNSTWITENEKRSATGYDKYEDSAADILYQNSGLLPLGFDVLEEDDSKNMKIKLMDYGLTEEQAELKVNELIQSFK